MRKSWFFIGLFTFLSINTTQGLQTYSLADQHHLNIPISNTEMNRIAVLGDRIQQIFGLHELCDLQSDEETGQIFVRLLTPSSSKSVTLTLITESGLTQDLTLKPDNIGFQSILLKPKANVSISREKAPSSNSLISLFKAMALNEPLASYNRETPQKADRIYPEPLTCISHMLYSSRESLLEGRVYRLINEGEVPLELSEQALELPQDVALSLTSTHLKPQEEALLLVVSKRGDLP